MEAKEAMNEINELDKALKSFKKYFFLNLLFSVMMLGFTTYWIISDEVLIDIPQQIPFLKAFIKILYRHMAHGIFLSCLISIIMCSIQVVKLFKVVLLLNEQINLLKKQIENNKANS